ncbi:DUF4113 domain-containing protein [Aeromonas veronii]
MGHREDQPWAACGQDTQVWMMTREQLSPRYTTCLKEHSIVSA